MSDEGVGGAVDTEALEAIRRELCSFGDGELWVLLELIVAEMQDRTLLDDPDRITTEPLRIENRPEPE